MSLNSQRFRQFHPTVMSVSYFISCFITIRQNVFPVPFLAESVQTGNTIPNDLTFVEIFQVGTSIK